MDRSFFCVLGLVSGALFFLVAKTASALPAFAIRENVSCTLCHTNGSAPHLTKYGYLYRKAGYRYPGDIGNTERDAKAMRLSEHMAIGANLDYEYATNKPVGTDTATTTANQFDAREMEVWPMAGAFLGNVGAFSEVDASPSTVSPGFGGTYTTNGGVELTHAELDYVRGDADLFFNFRGGLIAPQGYGASDQWIDDGNMPFIDSFTARLNEDTLVVPVGANQTTQLGAEVGINYQETHFSLGAYNGFDGTNGFSNNSQSALNPVLFNGYTSGSKDFKAQLDQFIGNNTAFTVVYYKGTIPLLDPSNTLMWRNHFSTWRAYATESIIPSQVDLLAGGSLGTFEYTSAGSNTAAGVFNSWGGFVGANYYVVPHLTLSGRLDYFVYNRFQGASQTAKGAALMVGVPFDYMLVNFHYNYASSDFTGVTHDFRLEWRVLY